MATFRIGVGAVAPTHYFHLLVSDILLLLVRYVLYDPDQDYVIYKALFAGSLFGALTAHPLWPAVLADRARVLYYQDWASTDYAGMEFLRYDGGVDYPRLVEHLTTTLAACAATDAADDSLCSASWTFARRCRLDVLSTRLRTRVAGYLQNSDWAGPVLGHRLRGRLGRVLAWPALLAVPHSILEQAVTTLFEHSPPDSVYDLLRGGTDLQINYPFFTLLYTTYIHPRVGDKLGRAPSARVPAASRAELNHWRAAWCRAALTSTELTPFWDTCERLGLRTARLRKLVCAGAAAELSLDIATLCAADATQIITVLDLWTAILPAHVGQLIIPCAPRLRGALRARGYTLSSADLAGLSLRGLPADIVPFLGPDVTPTVLTTLAPASVTPAVLLALLQHHGQPLREADLYTLWAAPLVQAHNLMNYVLPVERLVEAAFRALVTHLDQRWGFIVSADSDVITAATDVVPLLDESVDAVGYVQLYRLFLVYHLEHHSQPAVPFHCYDFARCEPGAIIEYFTVEAGTGLLAPCPHPRLLVYEQNDTVLFTPLVVQFTSDQLNVVYLPSYTHLVVTGLDELAHCALYDYDVADFIWLKQAAITRGYAAEEE